jgi:RNA polymerase sigma-70 factor (ECF subfamily)
VAGANVELSEETVRGVEPVLLGFALRQVRDPGLARDLVQETYVAVLEAKSTFEGRSSLRTWMVGILSRKIIDHYRRTRREVLTDVPPEPEAPSKFAPSPPAAPDSRLDQRKALEVVERSLAKLTELERMAVLLVDVERLDRTDARNVMGVEPTHLRVLLHRARHKLRRALEDAELAERAP